MCLRPGVGGGGSQHRLRMDPCYAKCEDCLVGCAAAASMLGVSLFRGATPKKVKRNRKRVAYL